MCQGTGRCRREVPGDRALTAGARATDAFAVRGPDLRVIGTLMSRLRKEPPGRSGGIQLARIDDLSLGWEQLPATDALRYHLEDESRVIVRQSGTEPKLKVYLDGIINIDPPADLPPGPSDAHGR